MPFDLQLDVPTFRFRRPRVQTSSKRIIKQKEFITSQKIIDRVTSQLSMALSIKIPNIRLYKPSFYNGLQGELDALFCSKDEYNNYYWHIGLACTYDRVSTIAILLHELGHWFTHYSYIKRNRKDLVVSLYSIRNRWSRYMVYNKEALFHKEINSPFPRWLISMKEERPTDKEIVRMLTDERIASKLAIHWLRNKLPGLLTANEIEQVRYLLTLAYHTYIKEAFSVGYKERPCRI